MKHVMSDYVLASFGFLGYLFVFKCWLGHFTWNISLKFPVNCQFRLWSRVSHLAQEEARLAREEAHFADKRAMLAEAEARAARAENEAHHCKMKIESVEKDRFRGWALDTCLIFF